MDKLMKIDTSYAKSLIVKKQTLSEQLSNILANDSGFYDEELVKQITEAAQRLVTPSITPDNEFGSPMSFHGQYWFCTETALEVDSDIVDKAKAIILAMGFAYNRAEDLYLYEEGDIPFLFFWTKKHKKATLTNKSRLRFALPFKQPIFT